MRFVLISTHTDQLTGYSKVASNLLQQVSTIPDVKVFHFGFQRNGARSGIRKAPKGVIQYDAAANEEPREQGFGTNKIFEYLETVNPDVVMMYNDPMLINSFLDAMKYEKGKTPYKFWVYLDLVYTGTMNFLIERITKAADRVYMFSDSWVKEYLTYGPVQNIGVIEHAVDSTVFSRISPIARESARAANNLPPDSILFLNANRNSIRKRTDLCIMSFVELISRDLSKPYFMMLVTAATPQGGGYYDLVRIYLSELAVYGISVESIGQRLIIVDTGTTALSDEKINEIYNVADIGINTSDGEGFGLCQLEHLFVGAPQVVTDVGVYSEFLPPDTCEIVPADGRAYFNVTMAIGFKIPLFSHISIADAMQRTIDTLDERREAIKNHQFKTWDEVCANWLTDIRNECK
jgi:hypothetical protein